MGSTLGLAAARRPFIYFLSAAAVTYKNYEEEQRLPRDFLGAAEEEEQAAEDTNHRVEVNKEEGEENLKMNPPLIILL